MAFASGKKWGLEHAVFAGATAATIFGAVTGRERVQQVAKPLIAPALATRVLRRRDDLDTADAALLVAGLAAATVGDVFMIDPDVDGTFSGDLKNVTLQQALDEPQVAAMQFFGEVAGYPGLAGPVRVPNLPVELTATPGGIEQRPPLLGEHTDVILERLGYSPAEIVELRSAKVV